MMTLETLCGFFCFFFSADVAQLIQRNICIYLAKSSCGLRYLVRADRDKVLKKFLRQHLALLCRSLPHPLSHLPLHLWDPPVLPGDSTGAVHQPRRGHCLEEDLSHLWRWVKSWGIAGSAFWQSVTHFLEMLFCFVLFSFLSPLLSLPSTLSQLRYLSWWLLCVQRQCPDPL